MIFPLRAKGCMVQRKGKRLLGPLDLELAGQGVTAVIGPNGAGKTTLLKALHGIERLSAGEIVWAVHSEDAFAEQAFVFQTPIMLRRSVAKNLSYPLELVKMPKGEADKRVADWAGRIGLSGMMNAPATRLSGGERQKLAIARALIREPRALFLDEPTSSLDGSAMREIEQILLDAARSGTRVIFSSHDMAQVRRLSDETIMLYRGQIEARAQTDLFFNAPPTQRAAAFIQGEIVE